MKLGTLSIWSLMSVLCLNQVLADVVTIDSALIDELNKEYSEVEREHLKSQKEISDLKKKIEEITEIAKSQIEEITLSENFTFAEAIDFLEKVKESGKLTDSNKENIQNIFEKFGINENVDDMLHSDPSFNEIFQQIWKAGIKAYVSVINRLFDKIKDIMLTKQYKDLLPLGDDCFGDEGGYGIIFESGLFGTVLFNQNRALDNNIKTFNKELVDIRREIYPNAKEIWMSVRELLASGEQKNVQDLLGDLGQAMKQLLSKVSRLSRLVTKNKMFAGSANKKRV